MIQIYTGEGKGKTTAAVGLALRAAGAGMNILFVEYIKNGKSSEIPMLEKIPNINIKCFGSGERINPKKGNVKEITKISKGIEYVCRNFSDYDLIVMDEAVTAVDLKLLSEKELICLAEGIGKQKEIVLTGHNASKALKKVADLVTEMKPIKHYYKKGEGARKGIEF